MVKSRKSISTKFSLPEQLIPPPSAFQDISMNEITVDDRIQLSLNLIRNGEERLIHGDSSGVQYFESALKLCSDQPNLLFKQGLCST